MSDRITDLEVARKVLSDPYPPDIFTPLPRVIEEQVIADMNRLFGPNTSARLYAGWARRLFEAYEHYSND